MYICTCIHRKRGGREAEQEERQRWNQREQKRILDSVKGTESETIPYTMYIRAPHLHVHVVYNVCKKPVYMCYSKYRIV